MTIIEHKLCIDIYYNGFMGMKSGLLWRYVVIHYVSPGPRQEYSIDWLGGSLSRALEKSVSLVVYKTDPVFGVQHN